MAPHHLSLITFLSSSLTTLSLAHSDPTTLACWLILKYLKHPRTHTHYVCLCIHCYLCYGYSLSGFVQDDSSPSSLFWSLLNVSSERPTMTTIFNTVVCPSLLTTTLWTPFILIYFCFFPHNTYYILVNETYYFISFLCVLLASLYIH